jgi:hypothetical protein
MDDKNLRAHFYLNKHTWKKVANESFSDWATYVCKDCGVLAKKLGVAGMLVMRYYAKKDDLNCLIKGFDMQKLIMNHDLVLDKVGTDVLKNIQGT